MTDRERMMKQVQMYKFAAIDASLFLDTHPTDKEAFSYFNKMKKLALQAKEDYEKKYGPISMSSMIERTNWDWVNAPWPWEVDA